MKVLDCAYIVYVVYIVSEMIKKIQINPVLQISNVLTSFVIWYRIRLCST